MSILTRQESKRHRKKIIPVNTSCQRTSQLTDSKHFLQYQWAVLTACNWCRLGSKDFFLSFQRCSLKQLLLFRFQYQLYNKRHIKISFKLRIVSLCTNFPNHRSWWMIVVLRMTPTLFDGDYSWCTEYHNASTNVTNGSFCCILNGLFSHDNFP